MSAIARLLPDGQRLHLQHGPSDLILWVEGARDAAYRAATDRFQTIIAEIVAELDDLREKLCPDSPRPLGPVARRMHDACLPFARDVFVTRMAAVAGSIADEILMAMRQAGDIRRAYVNNGGDIAVYLAPGTSFRTAIRGFDGRDLGRLEIAARDGVGGIATSGRHGRSHSLGIADSVTVLARSAATADVAATLIANAVDLPGHPAITRRPACELDEASDLGTQPVTVAVGGLSETEGQRALASGLARARAFQAKGRIAAAGLFLQGQCVTTGALVIPREQEAPHVEA